MPSQRGKSNPRIPASKTSSIPSLRVIGSQEYTPPLPAIITIFFIIIITIIIINIFLFFSLQYDPEGFGEIPWDDFLQVLKSPDFITEVDANKREILQEKAQERKTSAITFQDFVNVVSLFSIIIILILITKNIFYFVYFEKKKKGRGKKML